MAIAAGGPPAPRKRLVLLLAGAAGCLDAVGYLTLGLFTANMTGNTILLGLSVGRQAWPEALRNVIALAAFVVGAGAGTVIVSGFRRLDQCLALEAAVLAAGVAVWLLWGAPRGHIAEPGPARWLVALFAAAMGIQSAAVRRVGEHRVATTYVTGTLTSVAMDMAADLLDRWNRRRRMPSPPEAKAPPAVTEGTRGAPLLTGLWGVYLFGALVGGFAEQRWSIWAVVAPIGVLAGAVAADAAQRRREAVTS
jgi:uncharacterized membrane protein YoaK (UPF0700 family)